ncbi:receptor expression enhancing protein 3 [Gigaspora margarita]|uniref:Protein YOP1 n=2 Tax=Gigaspora margarita TaxID=4874 RepID=A0A8H4EI65_GIGMA|nr:receptor expression enhancing protein 3 [Gigaspora margarita]
MMFGYFMYRTVCNVVGYLYPAYASFKAIKANNTKNITAWLTYWIVMALFSVGEGTADNFIFWLPFYYEIKMIFVIWLILPQTQGATRIYDSYVVPILTRYEKEIDKKLGMAQEQVTNQGPELVKQGLELSKQGLAKLYEVAAEGILKVSH